MMITRTPLRIASGGGTDLAEYSERRGGCFTSAAIDRHICMVTNGAAGSTL